MPAMNDNTLRTRISHTWVGQEYGWDFADQADVTLLRENLRAAELILLNPRRFPHAPQSQVQKVIAEIVAFLVLYTGERP